MIKAIIGTIVSGFLAFLGYATLVFVLSLILALPVMWLWNAYAVAVFSVKVITFWQSWGILLLSGLLFRK